MSVRKLSLAFTVLAAAGCTPAPIMPAPDAGSVPQGDAAPSAADAAPAGDAGLSCMPALNNIGTMEGSDFAPLSLPSCTDGDPDYAMYNQDFCDSRVTVLIVSAGWCVPCMMEAPMIQSEIVEGYQGRGVRVIYTLAENPQRGATPTTSFCRSWQGRYGLTAHMTIDPNNATGRYFPMMAFPANLVIDRHGRIRYRVYGTQAGLADLKAAIDTVLAEP